MELKYYPDDILRKKCKEVDNFTDAGYIGKQMVSVMYKHSGIGISAPQVGLEQKIIVIDQSLGKDSLNNSLILINPVIMSKKDTQNLKEGCLSFPGLFASVKRANEIVVSYYTPEQEHKTMTLNGLLSVCVQHEIDHLNGILFVDYLSPLKLQIAKKQQQKLIKRRNFDEKNNFDIIN
jgi:peptide deformylase